MTSNPSRRANARTSRSDSNPDSAREYCPACERETTHDISLEVVETATDRAREKNRKFARGPCRVSTCRECGATSRTFVNR